MQSHERQSHLLGSTEGPIGCVLNLNQFLHHWDRPKHLVQLAGSCRTEFAEGRVLLRENRHGISQLHPRQPVVDTGGPKYLIRQWPIDLYLMFKQLKVQPCETIPLNAIRARLLGQEDCCHSFASALFMNRDRESRTDPYHVLEERPTGGRFNALTSRGIRSAFEITIRGALVENSNTLSAARILEALSFAAQQHRRQRRKDADATPYINHPISVAAILASEAGVEDEATIIAALLHDTVEDTGATFEEIASRFGTEVSKLVQEVSDDKSLPKETRKELQIAHARSSSPKAKLIKIADKIANLRDLVDAPPAEWSPERIRRYFDWASEVVEECRGLNTSLERLFDHEWARNRAVAS